MKNEELRAKYENFGFALCGIIGNLYKYLSDKEPATVPIEVAKAYCEAADAMLEEGAIEIIVGENKCNMDDIEELMETLRAQL